MKQFMAWWGWLWGGVVQGEPWVSSADLVYNITTINQKNNYGLHHDGNGIRVVKFWLSFENFLM